jgi:hypothetical protein
MEIKRISKKNKKAYSLVEVLVSLGIMAIVITMLFNVLIIGLESSLKVIGRSFVREEVANVTALITRDLRNSDKIVNCGESVNQSSCEFFKNNIRYKWSFCTDDVTDVCKYDLTNISVPVKIFESSKNVDVTILDFSQGFGSTETDKSKSVLFTIVASHSNSYINVTNVFKQSSVSTRNYTYQ